jgi:hypothetical protein
MSRLAFVSPCDVAAFEAGLLPHQRATLSDGHTSLVQRALQEHNVSAAAAIYRNISLSALAGRLGVAPAKAEAVAARMIAEGRVTGYIDEVDGFIDFALTEDSSAASVTLPVQDAGSTAMAMSDGAPGVSVASSSCRSSSRAPLSEPPAVNVLLEWDATIKSACAAVKGAFDAVTAAHPQLTPS